MFWLCACSEDDTISLQNEVSLRRPKSSWCANTGAVFLYINIKSKRHPSNYLHECLSTIINMVLSVQVYYYSDINIANFIRYFLHVLSSFLPLILDYFHLMHFVCPDWCPVRTSRPGAGNTGAVFFIAFIYFL